MDSSDRARDHMRWEHIEAAVLDVYYENQHKESTSEVKAHADTWGIHSALKTELFERARGAWMERTGKRIFDFPYNDDFIASLYFKFRKRNQEELREHYRQIQGGGVEESEGLFSQRG